MSKCVFCWEPHADSRAQAPCGLQGWKNRPIRFLARCCKMWLNQAVFVCCVALVLCECVCLCYVYHDCVYSVVMCFLHLFLPCDAMCKLGLCCRPVFVRPSITFVYCIHTAEDNLFHWSGQLPSGYEPCHLFQDIGEAGTQSCRPHILLPGRLNTYQSAYWLVTPLKQHYLRW